MVKSYIFLCGFGHVAYILVNGNLTVKENAEVPLPLKGTEVQAADIPAEIQAHSTYTPAFGQLIELT